MVEIAAKLSAKKNTEVWIGIRICAGVRASAR